MLVRPFPPPESKGPFPQGGSSRPPPPADKFKWPTEPRSRYGSVYTKSYDRRKAEQVGLSCKLRGLHGTFLAQCLRADACSRQARSVSFLPCPDSACPRLLFAAPRGCRLAFCNLQAEDEAQVKAFQDQIDFLELPTRRFLVFEAHAGMHSATAEESDTFVVDTYKPQRAVLEKAIAKFDSEWCGVESPFLTAIFDL